MMRRCAPRFCAAASAASSQQNALRMPDRAPASRDDALHVLGLQGTAMPTDIKKAYHDLAKTHHPDMPGGDIESFRGITRAYLYLLKKNEELPAATNARYEEVMQAKAEGREPIPHEMDVRKRTIYSTPEHQKQYRWDMYAYELYLLMFSVSFFVFATLNSIFDARMGNSDVSLGQLLEGQKVLEDGVAEPLGIRSDVKEMESERKKRLQRENMEAFYKAKTTYKDIRDFLLAHDENVLDRAVNYNRFPSHHVAMSRLAECFPVVFEIDTSNDTNGYISAVQAVSEQMDTLDWRFVDAPVAAEHVLHALGLVPDMNPAMHHITTIEYRANDLEKAPTGVVAIVNRKFEERVTDTAYAQRIVISGSDDLHPQKMRARLNAVKANRLDLDSLAVGKTLSLKNRQNQGWLDKKYQFRQVEDDQIDWDK